MLYKLIVLFYSRQFVLLLAGLFLLGGAGKSFACSCGQTSAEQRFDSAAAVLTGEITEITKSGFKVLVDKSWKGVTTTEISLAATKTDCDPDFKVQRKYLIYARNTEKGWQTGKCEGAFELTVLESQLSTLVDKQTLALTPVDSARRIYLYAALAVVLLIGISAAVIFGSKFYSRKSANPLI